MPDPNDTIIGSLPEPEDIEIPEDEEREHELPSVIMGSLPGLSSAPRHEINHTHFTPDGKIVRCRCGWESGLCHDDETLSVAWINHL